MSAMRINIRGTRAKSTLRDKDAGASDTGVCGWGVWERDYRRQLSGTVEEADPSGEPHTVLAPRTGHAADESELSEGNHDTRPFGPGIFFRSL